MFSLSKVNHPYSSSFLQSFSYQEILAPSSDEEELRQAIEQRVASENLKTERPRRRPGLAAELERAASVSGLSRRSKRSILLRGRKRQSDESSDEEDGDFSGGSRFLTSSTFIVLLV